MQRTVQALQADSTARISLAVVGEPVLLRPSVQDELYSIGREALTNAVRHASASEIVLELAYQQKQLRLCCRDNGMGVDDNVLRAGAKQGHWGITGMRERGVVLVASSNWQAHPPAELWCKWWWKAAKPTPRPASR